jgi:hypothetical protein
MVKGELSTDNVLVFKESMASETSSTFLSSRSYL